jgi:FlaG/FlaF family flagellin (archaellin)
VVNWKRIFSDKRAITPVLSNLLLMVVAVGAMAIATTATYIVTTNLRENMSERAIMEDIWFNNSTNSVDIYLRNIGKVSIHVSAVYINHTSQPFPSSFNLEIGRHGWLNVSYTWVSGGVYYVDVVTSRGTHVGSYYEAP